MPRKKRLWVPDDFYHVVCRGNRRDPLFRNATDFEVFLHILQQLHEKYPFEFSSYCLMTTHYHLQIRSPEIPFSKLMALINKRYANYYNTKYKLTGHVYEKRYFAKNIYGREGMLKVSQYIHMNPVAAGMARKPENYPWSSFQLYKYQNLTPWVFMNLESILRYYPGSVEEKKEHYCRGL